MDHINIIGPINRLGYGIHANNMLKAFNDIGLTTSLTTAGEIQDNDNIDVVMQSVSTPFKNDSPTLHIFHDEYLDEFPGKYTIGFSVFETDVVPQETIQKIEKYCEMVFTTTEDHKNILIMNGITKPVEVINEGVNPELFNVEPVDKLIDTGKYTYLVLGKNEKRKNTSKTMTALIEKVQYENVAMILHTFNPFLKTNDINKWYNINPIALGYKIVEDTQYYIKFTNSYSDIYYTKAVLDTVQMKQLYHSANVGINCSSAEGWGLPEMEMMACGKPVIISNVIGHKEYIKNLPVYNELIIEPIGKEIANDGLFFKGNKGSWYTIDISDIKDKVKYAFENNIGETISEELSNYITTNYNWKLQAEKIKQIINRG